MAWPLPALGQHVEALRHHVAPACIIGTAPRYCTYIATAAPPTHTHTLAGGRAGIKTNKRLYVPVRCAIHVVHSRGKDVIDACVCRRSRIEAFTTPMDTIHPSSMRASVCAVPGTYRHARRAPRPSRAYGGTCQSPRSVRIAKQQEQVWSGARKGEPIDDGPRRSLLMLLLCVLIQPAQQARCHTVGFTKMLMISTSFSARARWCRM